MKNNFLKILFVFGILFYSINSFAAWTSIGTSVNYQETGNTGKVAAIIYTGCGVSDTGAKAWADALYNSVLKNKGVGYLYAVSLPASYGCDKINTPISNTKIISDLKDKYGKSLVTNTVVIMHSSGAYIANEFFNKALAEEPVFKKTFTVFNVDGDNGINVYAAKLFNKSYPVAGKSGSLNSRNSAVTGTETKIVIDLPGCSTADCIHMKLINKNSSVSSVTTDFAKIDPAYSSTTTNNVTNSYLDKLTNVSVSTTGSGGGTTPLVGSSAANTSTTLTAKTFNEQTGINASAGSYELISPIGNLSKIPDVSDNGFSDFVNLLIRIAIALAGAIAVVMLIIGGIQYMGTDSVWEKGESRSRMTSAIIGLVLLLTSYFILFNINPDLVDIRIGGLRVSEGEWEKVDFDSGIIPGVGSAGVAADCPTKQLIQIPNSLKKKDSVDNNICKEFADKLIQLKAKTSLDWIITSTTDGQHQSLCHKDNNAKSGSCVDIAIYAGADDVKWGELCEAVHSISGIDFLNEASKTPKCESIHKNIQTKYGTGSHLHIIYKE